MASLREVGFGFNCFIASFRLLVKVGLGEFRRAPLVSPPFLEKLYLINKIYLIIYIGVRKMKR